VSATPISPHRPFDVAVVPDRREVAVVPDGDLDLSTVDQVEREVDALRAAGFDRIVLDLRRVAFLDSSGLRLLLGLRNTARRTGLDLQLIPGPREVQRVFELTATHSLFDWRDG
jgi:anti-sigma B factor antagonist